MTSNWPVPIVSIIGWHNSGKTTVAAALVRIWCARGLHVAAVKHSREDVELDRPGTDTFVLAEAGADVVVISSRGRLAFLERPAREASLREIIARLPAGIDIVVVEGYKGEDTPKVEVVRSGNGEGRISAPGELLAIVSQQPIPAGAVPVYAFDQCDALATYLLAKLFPPA